MNKKIVVVTNCIGNFLFKKWYVYLIFHIVSDLYSDEVWSNLTRSEKNTISKQLAKNVRENPDQYTVNAVLPGKITQYRKI